MFRFLLSLLLALSALSAVSARPVSADEACSAAWAWMREGRGVFGAAEGAVSVAPISDRDGRCLGYAVSFADGRSLILSGDTRVTPVIACLPHGSPEALPAGHPLPALLRADLAARLRARSGAVTLGLGPSAEERRWERLLGKTGGASVFGLTLGTHPARIFALDAGWLTGRLSHWNQFSHNRYGDWPLQAYDRLTPNHWPVGCVAVSGCALLQAYGVRQGPAPGTVKACAVGGVPTELRTVGGPYAWEILPGRWRPSQPLNDTQAELLGRAAYDMGVCCEMHYGPSASSASQVHLAKALREHFGFTRAVYAADPRPEDYEALIYAQLRCRAPVGLSVEGDSPDGHLRHAVVAAGYAEDAARTPFVYLFMGWGGAGDTWYSLPSMGDYSVINAVVTLLEAPGRAASLPVCGLLTDPRGRPAPGQNVTLTYTAGGRTETHTLRTGRHGTFGLRLPYREGRVTVRHGSAVRELTLKAPDCSADAVYAEHLAPDLPRPLPPLVSDTAFGLDILTDGRTARDEALRTGLPILVLSGPTDTDTARGLLRALAETPGFGDSYVFYLCDRDENSRDMTSESLRCAVFDPRRFDASLGWQGNTVLAELSAPAAAALPGFLSEADRTWGHPTLIGTDTEGPAVAYTYAAFRLLPRFSDGIAVRSVPGQSWEVTEGRETADFNAYGLLVPREGRRGTVSIRGTGFLWGQVLSGTGTVRIVLPDDIRSLSLSAPEDLWLETMRGDILGKDLQPHPGFVLSCTGRLEDGTVLKVAPDTFRLTHVSDGVRADCASGGEIWYTEIPTETHTISAEATFGALTATVGPLTVDGADTVFPASWELASDDLWPGDVLRLKNLSYWHRSRGKTTLRHGWEGLGILLETETGVFPQTPDRTEAVIPAATETTGRIPYFLGLRLKGGRNESYTGNGGLDPAFTLHAALPATSEAHGSAPHSRLRHLAGRLGLPAPADGAAYDAFADADSDGDGYTNAEEFILGTDPADAASTFVLRSFLPRPGRLPELNFDAVPGRSYRLLGAPAPEGPWGPADAAHAFFRIGITLTR